MAEVLADCLPEPGVAKPDAILTVDGLHRSFGGLLAVGVEHLEIPRGVITAVIGPNGAGKTTLFNVLTGFEGHDAGVWHFEGQALAGLPAHQVAGLGMVRTFQLTKALARLSVLDNMKLGARRQSGERFFPALRRARWSAQEQQVEERADALLERFRLDHLRDAFAGTLSGGQRKLLEMARALMVEPTLLLLDEPMAGVNPALTQSLLGHVAALADEGMTVAFIEHNMDVVMGISDWVVCLALGAVIAEGPPGSIAANTDVIDAYLGARHGGPT